MLAINYHEFENMFEAWTGLNTWMAQNEDTLLATPGRGGRQGGVLFAYNNVIRIKSHKTYKENWDIGKALGYATHKWNSLVDNYVDMNYLDLIKHEVASTKTKVYNLSYHFKNKHGHGKDCLVALNFSRRVGMDYPIVVFTVRTSEITRRLIFDLVLVQRMIEYVYPDLTHVEVHLQMPILFLDAESFVLFNNTKSVDKILSKVIPTSKGNWAARALSSFRKLSTVDPETITWKVHQRSAYFVQNKDHDKVGLFLKDFHLPKQTLHGQNELYDNLRNKMKI